MTDKQIIKIIINGVDVSGCGAYHGSKPRSNSGVSCNLELNSYFKQLKQTLDDIEEFCLCYRENPVEGSAYDKILNIINKAKES